MKKLIALLAIICLSYTGHSQTIVNSNISSNTTWTLAGSPYLISGFVDVDSGITLTIDPGVEVEFVGNQSLDVNGDLYAIGTQQDSIRFKGNSQGNSIRFKGIVECAHVRFESMRTGLATSFISSPSPTYAPDLRVRNCLFVNNTTGINANPIPFGSTSIDSSSFINNYEGVNVSEGAVGFCYFEKNRLGLIGSNVDAYSCEFVENEVGSYSILYFSILNCDYRNNEVGAMIQLEFSSPIFNPSEFSFNALEDNKIGIRAIRDTGMVAPTGIEIKNNKICNDSLNFFYDKGPNGPATFPLLDLSENCWCEWDSTAVVATFSNPSNQPIVLLPLDSTCLPRLVFPGDANHDQLVNNNDLLPIGLHFGETGPIRPSASLNWLGQRCPDWTTTQSNGINVKHADTDGDGSVSLDDTLAINLNYGLTHNSWRVAAPQSGIPLRFSMPTGPLSPGDTLEIPVELGTVDTPAVGIYGMAFSVNYDPLVIDSAGIKVRYSSSWLGSKNVDMITLDKDFHPQGRIDLALSRTDQASVNGFGMICTLVVVISDDLAKKQKPFELSFQSLLIIDEFGNPLDVNVLAGQSIIDLETRQEELSTNQAKVYPNPTKEFVFVEGELLKEIKLWGMDGRTYGIWKGNLGQRKKLNLPNLAVGIYLLDIQTEKGQVFRKLVVKE